MKNGIQGAGTEFITVMLKLSYQRLAVYRLLRRVVQDMNLDKAEKELSQHNRCVRLNPHR